MIIIYRNVKEGDFTLLLFVAVPVMLNTPTSLQYNTQSIVETSYPLCEEDVRRKTTGVNSARRPRKPLLRRTYTHVTHTRSQVVHGVSTGYVPPP